MINMPEPCKRVFVALQGQPPEIILQAARLVLALLEKAMEPADDE